jgi:DNA-binding MarR family transcriptional regulator
MVSDLEIVVHALARIELACRARGTSGAPGRGAVTPHQARILGHLDVADPTMVGELAEFMGVTPSTMSLNLKRLVEGGLVTRERDPLDRRVMNVRLTDAGERIRDASGQLDADSLDAALRRLRSDDRRDAVRGLALLADAAEAVVRGSG